MQNENELAAEGLDHSPNQSKHGQTSENSSQMNIQTDVNLTKKKRIIFWVYLFTILAFFIAITVLSVNSYTPTQQFLTTDNYYYANQVATEWQKGFVIGATVVNGSNSTCPAGYENAINFDWSGSTYGCFCNTNANLSFVLQGYCSPGLIQAGCSNMFNRQPIYANNWKNNGRLCLQRSTVSFATQSKYDGTNTICGSSQSLVIMPSGSACPYVNISFSQFSLEDHYSVVSDTNQVLNPLYVSYNSTSPYSFYSYPLIKFAVSEYQFCQMDQDTGIDPSHSDFILLNFARGCASVGQYNKLDSTTEIVFYASNPNLQALTYLAGFPNPGNWDYLFGFSSLTGWTYRCRHTFYNRFSIPNAIKQFNFTYQSTYSNYLIGVTVCLIIIIVEIVVLTLRRIINSAVYPVGYKQKYLLKHFWIGLSRYIIDIGAKVTIFGISLTNVILLYSNYNWFKSAVNLNCPDSNLTTMEVIMKPFITLYQKLFTYALATLVICFAMLVIDLVHFVYIYRNELAFYLVGTEDKMIVKREEDEEMKWIEQKDTLQLENKDLELSPNKDEGEQFRITMAQNIFSRDEVEPATKLKKKKKKKVSLLRRQNNDLGVKEEEGLSKAEGGFNPYSFEDDSLSKLDSPEFKSAPFKTIDKKRRKK